MLVLRLRNSEKRNEDLEIIEMGTCKRHGKWVVGELERALSLKIVRMRKATSFPGFLILPTHRASEERPWLTVTWHFDN